MCMIITIRSNNSKFINARKGKRSGILNQWSMDPKLVIQGSTECV